MASELVSQIQRHIAEYLDGKVKLHELEDRFVPMLWDLHESDDEQARALVGEVEILIAETSHGDRTIESVQEEMAKAVCPSFLRKYHKGEQ
jgi:hypothetical protein